MHWVMVVKTRDTISEKRWDSLEATVNGRTLSQSDNGASNLTITISPRTKPTKSQRRETLKAVQAICQGAFWKELS